MIDHNTIIRVFRGIPDPATGLDIIEAKRISELKVQENVIYFALDATGYDANTKSQVHMALNQSILNEYPDADVHIHMKSSDPQANKSSNNIPHIKNIIAVASGKGGVGKSTISTNLAIALKNTGASVGLLDADLYGPSIPTMLGLKGKRPEVKEIFGKHKILPLEAYGISVMSIGFIVEPEQAVVLRGPRLSGVIKQFIEECIWPPLDYLVIDLPPGTGDIQLTLVQTVPVTGAIIVTTPQEVSVIDAVKAMNMFRLQNINVPILGVVENMSWFTPEELPDNKYYLFGKGGGAKLAQKAETKLLGQVPIVQSIRENSDQGEPAAANEAGEVKTIFDQLASNTIRQVKLRNEMQEPSQVVAVNK